VVESWEDRDERGRASSGRRVEERVAIVERRPHWALGALSGGSVSRVSGPVYPEGGES